MEAIHAAVPEGQITPVPGHPDLFEVQGSQPEPYYVNSESGACSCPGFRYRCADRGVLCKHGEAVKRYLEKQDGCPYCTAGFVLLQLPYLGPDATPESPLQRCSICDGSGKRAAAPLPSQEELRRLFR